MIDLNFFTNYLVIVIIGICCCVGYVIKTSFPKIDNRYIPLILVVLGIILNDWLSNWDINPDVILGGMISGLASIGCHQAFKNMIIKKQKEDDDDFDLCEDDNKEDDK